MKSRATADFWREYDRLPPAVKRSADKAYARFCQQPRQASLRFKALAAPPNHYSVRINEQYRAVAVRDGDTLIWFWIGTHNAFDKLF
jgi:hypothetical protein